MDEYDWISGHSAPQDGARLQAPEASHTYDALLRWYMKRVTRLRPQETMDEAKNKVEENTGLRPTNERLLKGIEAHSPLGPYKMLAHRQVKVRTVLE